MTTGELNFGALTICKVGDTLQVSAEHPQVGTWSYTARILWLRAGHLGLNPPDGRWQSLIRQDDCLSLHVQSPSVTATLITRAVGITRELPPVLVVRQETAITPIRPSPGRGSAMRPSPIWP